jgi:flagellar basal-body rod modification protein FlgD
MTTTQPTAASAATAASSAASASSSVNALTSLSGNFNDFLNLLMTQLQNQDPTTPLDTNQFTSQLVQFASVAQQINTNTSLTQLIQLGQGSEVVQAATLVGTAVAAQSTTLPLQKSTATLQIQSPSAQAATITISNAAGATLYSTTTALNAGTTSWSWNGQGSDGTTYPDGAYNVSVNAGSSGTSGAALSFNVVGTATGVVTDGTTPQLQIGSVTVPVASVRGVQ